jgi:hypothetical protein
VFLVHTTWKSDQQALNQMLRTEQGLVGKDTLRRARNVQKLAKTTAPIGKVNGGKMRASITAKVVKAGRGVEGEVTLNVPYAMWVTKGTGIYAGRGVIRPKSSPYMIFSTAYGRYNIPSYNGFYYARSIKGQKPNQFFVKTLPAALR